MSIINKYLLHEMIRVFSKAQRNYMGLLYPNANMQNKVNVYKEKGLRGSNDWCSICFSSPSSALTALFYKCKGRVSSLLGYPFPVWQEA